VRAGDLLRVDVDLDGSVLSFVREAEGLPVHEMVAWGTPPTPMLRAAASASVPEPSRAPAARSTRRS
jgi:hypothetical protein